MAVVPVITVQGTVTAVCTGIEGCGATSLDVTPTPLLVDDAGTVTRVRLTCDACGRHSDVDRLTPDRLVDTLVEVQDRRSHLDVATPGEWTLRVGVMWRALDGHGWPHEHADRRRRLRERWPEQ